MAVKLNTVEKAIMWFKGVDCEFCVPTQRRDTGGFIEVTLGNCTNPDEKTPSGAKRWWDQRSGWGQSKCNALGKEPFCSGFQPKTRV